MNRTATTRESDMKITGRWPDLASQSEPVYVMVSKFETDSFPVRVRHCLWGQPKVATVLVGVSTRANSVTNSVIKSS